MARSPFAYVVGEDYLVALHAPFLIRVCVNHEACASLHFAASSIIPGCSVRNGHRYIS